MTLDEIKQLAREMGGAQINVADPRVNWAMQGLVGMLGGILCWMGATMLSKQDKQNDNQATISSDVKVIIVKQEQAGEKMVAFEARVNALDNRLSAMEQRQIRSIGK